MRRAAVLPVALAVLATAEMLSVRVSGWVWGLAIELLACLVLAGRARSPVVSPVLATALATSLPVVDPALDEPAAPAVVMVAALFALARYNTLRTALLGFSVNLAQLVFYTLEVQDGFDPTNVVFIGGMSASPFVAGRIVRRLAEQSAQLVAQQELVQREAVIAERHRIARDLHDVIAHSISAMVVQTAAAQDLVRSDVDRAEALLANVADAGRAALAETGRLLHVIRDDADELGLAPAPGLANLGAMVQHFRDSGLAVDLSVDEPLPQLDPGADVSAYRVVQEVLTNALKHSPDRAVSLRLRVADGRLVIASSNGSDGHAGSGSGLGLLGMRERLALLGGDLRHGLSPEGRFTVTASLPIGATA